jgi:hypothetical protein
MARRRVTIEFDYDEAAEPDDPESYDAQMADLPGDIISERDV